MTVLPPPGKSLKGWTGTRAASGTLNRALDALTQSTGGSPAIDDDRWKGRIFFEPVLGAAELASLLDGTRRISLRGARLHFGAELSDGRYVPISFAFRDSRETVTMAAAEAANQFQRYGRGQKRQV